MLHLIYGLIGLATLGLVLLDLLWTMFLEGAGPLTKRICSWVGRVVLVAQGRCTTPPKSTKSGLLTVTATMLCWSLLLWLSWALIFSADPNSISATFPAAVEPSFWNRMFFVGCNISTLGTGDFRPNGKFWEFATVLTGGSGFLMLGVAITRRRARRHRGHADSPQVALNIWSLGKSPVDIISRCLERGRHHRVVSASGFGSVPCWPCWARAT